MRGRQDERGGFQVVWDRSLNFLHPPGGEAASAVGKRQFADHKELLVHTKRLREEMMAAAKNLDFELAARIRDEVYRLEKLDMELL